MAGSWRATGRERRKGGGGRYRAERATPRAEWIVEPRIELEFSFVPFSALAFASFFSFFFRRASPRGTAPRRKKSPIFSSLHFCVICFMERLLQINIIGIHRRVLSPTKRPARRGFYIFSTLHLLLLLLLPPPTLLPIFFVSPPPPLPLAASHQRRTSIAPSPPPPPPPLPPRSRDSHTRCTRALIFIIRVFWNFSSGAQHCFTVCHCYTPTSCQARERRGL